MITNHLLLEKHETQKRLSEEVDYDLHEYARRMHTLTLEAQARYGIELRISEVEGGTVRDEETLVLAK